MTCSTCQSICRKFGKHRNGLARYQCRECKRTFTEPHNKPLGGMYTEVARAEEILKLLVEGCSINTIQRVTGVHHGTILKILVTGGEKCEKLMGRVIVNVPVRDVRCDEIWAYVYKKEAHKLPAEANDETIGDAYCFVAVERYSKLVLNFALGRRSQATTDAFIEGLRAATAPQRFQLSTDGFQPYVSAITTTLSDRCDFAQLIKVYRAPQDGEKRYSPAEVASVEVVPVMGQPDPDRICTSIIERQNLSVRMGTRRFTRLTNGFSKKWENHWAAVSVWFAFYNFCRVHKSLRVTPAMEAKITDHAWSVGELLAA
jgi:transposase-like protein/IS1 family transposase